VQATLDARCTSDLTAEGNPNRALRHQNEIRNAPTCPCWLYRH
jgi:hypothetical protein